MISRLAWREKMAYELVGTREKICNTTFSSGPNFSSEFRDLVDEPKIDFREVMCNLGETALFSGVMLDRQEVVGYLRSTVLVDLVDLKLEICS